MPIQVNNINLRRHREVLPSAHRRQEREDGGNEPVRAPQERGVPAQLVAGGTSRRARAVPDASREGRLRHDERRHAGRLDACPRDAPPRSPLNPGFMV